MISIDNNIPDQVRTELNEAKRRSDARLSLNRRRRRQNCLATLLIAPAAVIAGCFLAVAGSDERVILFAIFCLFAGLAVIVTAGLSMVRDNPFIGDQLPITAHGSIERKLRRLTATGLVGGISVLDLEDFAPGYVLYDADSRAIYISGQRLPWEADSMEANSSSTEPIFPTSEFLAYADGDTTEILRIAWSGEVIPVVGSTSINSLPVNPANGFALLDSVPSYG